MPKPYSLLREALVERRPKLPTFEVEAPKELHDQIWQDIVLSTSKIRLREWVDSLVYKDLLEGGFLTFIPKEEWVPYGPIVPYPTPELTEELTKYD